MQSYAGNVGTPQVTQQPTQIGPTIGSTQAGIGGLDPYTQMGSSFAPYAQSAAMRLFHDPYAGQFQAGANQAAPYGMQAGQAQFATGASMIPYAQQIAQTGFDPQQALYNRTLQQTTDQQNAAMAAAGVGTTPYGQGLQSQNLSNFNIDWQNQQLQRQLAAAQGAGGAYQTATGLMSQAPQTMLQSASIPYATAQQIGTGQLGALSGGLNVGTQGANLGQLPIQDYLSLLSGQNQANTVANQAALGLGQFGLNQSALGWQQMAGLGSGLGSALGWLGGSGPQTLASNIGSFGKFLGV